MLLKEDLRMNDSLFLSNDCIEIKGGVKVYSPNIRDINKLGLLYETYVSYIFISFETLNKEFINVDVVQEYRIYQIFHNNLLYHNLIPHFL